MQQTRLNGNTYTKGPVIDLLDTYKIVCQEFPFTLLPEPKKLAERNWEDEDGIEVYVPSVRKMKEYTVDVDFLYKGTDETIRTDLNNFINFLNGRNTGAVGSRLVVYNEYTGIGRKDVTVDKISNELFTAGDEDPDAMAKFKVTFKVCDPTTDVTLTRTTNNGTTTLSLNF